MSSTNKTSIGLNMWEASDKPVRQDFVNDNVIVDEKISGLKQDIINGNTIIDEKISKLNSTLSGLSFNLSSGLSAADTSLFRFDNWTANRVVRSGKVVHLHCHFILLKQVKDWNEYTLVNLPTQYRASYEFNGEKYATYNGTSYLYQYFVRPSGTVTVKVDNNAPIGAACTLELTYLTN